MGTELTNITYKVPSCGIVLADRKDAESVSADRQSPDQKASRCRVRLAIGVPDPMHSNSRYTIFHDTYKIYGVLYSVCYSQRFINHVEVK